jgi:hypothetical protein
MKGCRGGRGPSVAEVSSWLRPEHSDNNANDTRDGHAMCLGLCIFIFSIISPMMHFDSCEINPSSFNWGHVSSFIR